MAIINNRNIQDVRNGFAKYFPEDTKYTNDESFSSGDFKWANREAFVEFVGNEVRVYIDPKNPQYSLVKTAQQEFEKRALTPEKSTEGTMPEDLKNLEEKAEIERVEYQKTLANAKKVTEDQIEALEKAQVIKGKIYAKVETLPQKPTPEADQVIEDFLVRNEGEVNQQSSVDQMADFLEQQITPTLSKDLSPEEIKGLSRKTAEDYIEAINNPRVVAAYEEAAVQDAILAAIANSDQVPDITRQAAEDLFISRRSGIESSRQIIEGALGPQFGQKFGRLPSEINVSLFANPVTGITNAIDIKQLNNGYGEYLQKHLAFINEVGSFAGDPKSYLLGQLGRAVDLRISRLPTDSLVRGLYGNSTVRNVFSFAVGRPVTITLDSSSWAGGLAIRNPGAFKFVNAATGMYGVKFTAGKGAGAAVAGLSEVGKDVAAKAGSGAISKIAGAAAGAASGLSVAATVTAATAPFLGIFAPVAGFIADVFVGIIGKEALSRISIFIRKHKEDFIAVMGLLAGGLIFRNIAGAAGLGLAGYFGAKAFFGGTRGLGNALFRFGSGLGQVQLFKSILKTLGIVLILIPILVVFVLFIINSGAYITPPAPAELSSANPYIDVTKTVDPAGPFPNGGLPQKLNYTITITAKQSDLTNVILKDDCLVITKLGQAGCPAGNASSSGTIAVGVPFVSTYSVNYKNYTDALIIDTVTVTANTALTKVQETAASASITIGNPPTGCLKIDGQWPSSYRSNMESAIAILAGKYSNYLALVCSGYSGSSLLLRYTPIADDSFWGRNFGSYVLFHTLGVKTSDDALYTLAHELGHSLMARVKGIDSGYRSFPRITSETPVCFYSYHGSMDERLPEAIAFYILGGKLGCPNVQTAYPIHYMFLKQFIFK